MDSETVRHGRWEYSLKLKRVELCRGDYMTLCLFVFFKLTVTKKRRQSYMLHRQLTVSAASFTKAVVSVLLIWLNK